MILHQVHSAKIIVVDHNTTELTQDGDGLITNIPGKSLSIKTADCLPVFFYYPKQKVVGVIHAGWRGADKGIHTKAVSILKSRFQSFPTDIIVKLGPGICANCYTFSQKPQQDWGKYIYKQQKWHVDLKGYVKSELLALGIKPDHIEDMNICTYEDNRFPSHRRSLNTGEPESHITNVVTLNHDSKID